MTAPRYVTRLVRVARAIPILAMHPTGMRLTDLARQLGTTEEELRQEIRRYYVADPPMDLAGGYREPLIEFAAGPLNEMGEIDGDADDYPDPASAAYVRLRDLRSGLDVGVKLMSLGELAVVSRIGHTVLADEPENTVLEAALDKLGTSVLDGFDRGGPRWLGEQAHRLRQAVREKHRVRIVYARTWLPGVVERVIEPYQVVHTRRGWEVDAAVAGRDGRARTYLVSGIRELDVLDEMFEPPTNVSELIDANRQLRDVDVVVPHNGRWAVELYAESAKLLAEDDTSVKLRAQRSRPIRSDAVNSGRLPLAGGFLLLEFDFLLGRRKFDAEGALHPPAHHLSLG